MSPPFLLLSPTFLAYFFARAPFAWFRPEPHSFPPKTRPIHRTFFPGGFLRSFFVPDRRFFFLGPPAGRDLFSWPLNDLLYFFCRDFIPTPLVDSFFLRTCFSVLPEFFSFVDALARVHLRSLFFSFAPARALPSRCDSFFPSLVFREIEQTASVDFFSRFAPAPDTSF